MNETPSREPEDDALDGLGDSALAQRKGLIGALFRHRRLLGGVGLAWFGLVMAGGLFLSQIDARRGLHVFGPAAWDADRAGVIRVGLRELRWGEFAPLGPVEIRFVAPDGAAGPAQTLTGRVGEFVQGRVTAPTRPGAWQITLTSETTDGQVTATVPVEVRAARPPGFPAPIRAPATLRPEEGPLRLDVAPTDHVLPAGLPASLTVRATTVAGEPVSTRVNLHLADGRSDLPIPAAVDTDAFGLATLSVRSVHPTFVLRLTADTSHGERPVRPVPAQFTLHPARTHVAPGATLPITLSSMHATGPVFIDAWDGDAWLLADGLALDAGHGQTTLTLPERARDPALVWIQAYRAAYLPGQARGGRYVLVTRKPALEATRWLAEQLAANGHLPEYTAHVASQLAALPPGAEPPPELTRALLGLLPRPDHDPPLIADSTATVRQTVSDLKARWQRRFVLALVGSALLLFVVLGLLLAHNHRELTRRWAEAGGDADGDRGTRREGLRDAGYIFAVLTLFLLGMIQLVLNLRW